MTLLATWPWRSYSWWRGQDRLIYHPTCCCQGYRDSAKKPIRLFYSRSMYTYIKYTSKNELSPTYWYCWILQVSHITSAMSSADGSPWSVNQLKNVFCSKARFLPFPTFFSLPFLVKSFPSFHRMGVLWEAGSPKTTINIQLTDIRTQYYYHC